MSRKPSAQKQEARLSALERLGVQPPRPGVLDMRLNALMPWFRRVFPNRKWDSFSEDERKSKEYNRMMFQSLFLQGVIYHYTYAAAALHANVSMASVQKWLADDELFADWVKQARDIAIDIVETGLFGSASDGKTDSYVFLQARRNDVYRYKGDNAGSGAEVKVVIVNQLPDGTLMPSQTGRIIDAPQPKHIEATHGD